MVTEPLCTQQNVIGMKRYILTGAPGAGKTSILRQLELDGFSVVEEAATDVIALRQANGIAEPWTHPEFLDAVVHLQQARERRAYCLPDPVQFHDRSVVCTAALADYLGFARPDCLLQQLQRLKEEHVFERRVLFARNLGFISPTEARRISYEETVRFEKLHEQAYREFGFDIISIAPASVANRVREIKRLLCLEHT
jgi:predicted ATPase